MTLERLLVTAILFPDKSTEEACWRSSKYFRNFHFRFEKGRFERHMRSFEHASVAIRSLAA
jgi:hypothetical protein